MAGPAFGTIHRSRAVPASPFIWGRKLKEQRTLKISFHSPVSQSNVGKKSGVQGAGCRVQGAGCRVQGAGCRVQGAGSRVQGAGCRVQGVGCRVQDAGSRELRHWIDLYIVDPLLKDIPEIRTPLNTLLRPKYAFSYEMRMPF